MNKYFKYSFLSLFAGLTLVSCGNDYEYEAAVPESESNPENAQVYFPFDNAAAYTLDLNATSVDVVICRVDSTEEQTVRLQAEGDSLINVPETVTFAAGATKANVTLTYDAEALGYDNTQKVTLMIADSAQTTAYGMSKYVFNVTLPAPWTPWTTTKKAWVAAGYDAEDWPLSEDQSTCTYYYTQYWSGADAGLTIAYRMSLLDPTMAQFRISNWGGGIDMYIDYNPETHKCVVPEQFSGAVSSSYGDVAFGDVSAWQGADYSASYPCTYDPEKGLFTLNVAYFVSAGAFGYGVETCQVDGFYVPDYSVDAEYLGIFTSPEQKPFAQINVKSIGVDAEKAVALIVTAEDDAAAVADALAAGEVTGTDVVAGYNNIAIEEGMTGELKVVVCTVLEGAAMDVKAFNFEYYGGGANPWKSLGTGLYTDAIVSDMYGIPAETYEVEITENTETPGVYRVMNPYGEKWSYAAANTQTLASYLEINAENPDAVYILPQMLGVNMEGGDTELGFASLAGYFYATGQASLEELATLGYMGKVVDGNILLPTFSKGTPGTADYFTYQGVVYYGSTKAYNAANGFKVVMPDAVTTSDLAKARKYTRRAVNFSRVRAHEMPSKFVKPLMLKNF